MRVLEPDRKYNKAAALFLSAHVDKTPETLAHGSDESDDVQV